jgi:hypothetical protein
MYSGVDIDYVFLCTFHYPFRFNVMLFEGLPEQAMHTFRRIEHAVEQTWISFSSAVQDYFRPGVSVWKEEEQCADSFVDNCFWPQAP